VKCPGQDSRFWKPEDVFEEPCPACGEQVEFFKADLLRRCPNCGFRFRNPRVDLGCAEWCPHAAECLGIVAGGSQGGPAEARLVTRLIEAVKREFGDDRKRIAHALSVLARAEEILPPGAADPRIVLAAALLHDIGIQEAERKHGSSAPPYQELEGPPIARRILQELALDEGAIEHICRIVANHHSAKDIDTPEFRIVWDADWLVNLPDEFPDRSADELKPLIERLFKTAPGKQRAYQLFGQGTQR
jgi:hypothetical protein